MIVEELNRLDLFDGIKSEQIKEKLLTGGKWVVKFDSLTNLEDMKICLQTIFDAEKELHDAKENKKEYEINLEGIKNLSLDNRVELLKMALKNEDLLDSTFLLNIFNFLKTFNNFDDSFFQSSAVFVNDFDEFCDLKDGVMEELEVVNKNIARYYISIIKTLGVTDFPANNLPQIMPYIYQRIFLISDCISLSNMIKKYKSVDNLIYVENAEYFFSNLANRYVFANFLIKNAGLAK